MLELCLGTETIPEVVLTAWKVIRDGTRNGALCGQGIREDGEL